MRRSTERILTTHVGSLPEPADLDPASPDYDSRLKRYVGEVVAHQRETGLDIINEGEYTKGGDWLSFIESRFGGFEAKERPAGELPLIVQGKDREEFADFYQYATERGSLFYTPGNQIRANRPYWVCTGPVTYTGQEELAREIALLKEAAGTEDVFLTSTAAASLEV
jgi:5-methyltetrahydropteroyltriglutamate--homocysteine methyltransferase